MCRNVLANVQGSKERCSVRSDCCASFHARRRQHGWEETPACLPEWLPSELAAGSDSVYVPAYGIALIYLGLGDHNTAVEWLLKAYEEHFIWLAYLNVDPVFDGVRAHPAFQRLPELMNFPESLKELRLAGS